MGISIPQLLIILVIVALLFGTKKLRGIGGDLGSALKGFKNAMKEETPETDPDNKGQGNMIENELQEDNQTAPKKEEQV